MGVTSNQKNHPMVTRLEAMEKKKDEENKQKQKKPHEGNVDGYK